ncbi:Gp49 family protein [Bacillus sp. OTU530]|uniref:Gp49 family protein n=1 Tax=Bacillus sp. OTU530 TaxID=3043862 RepID=UPI00313B34C1
MSKNTVTQAQVTAILEVSIIDVKTIFDKCTVVTAQLPSGFIIVESSACIEPVNYNEKLGAEICMKRIENKIWELEGYKLQCELAK